MKSVKGLEKLPIFLYDQIENEGGNVKPTFCFDNKELFTVTDITRSKAKPKYIETTNKAFFSFSFNNAAK